MDRRIFLTNAGAAVLAPLIPAAALIYSTDVTAIAREIIREHLILTPQVSPTKKRIEIDVKLTERGRELLVELIDSVADEAA